MARVNPSGAKAQAGAATCWAVGPRSLPACKQWKLVAHRAWLHHFPAPCFGFQQLSGSLVRGMLGYLRMDGLGTSWAPGPTLSLGSSHFVRLF